MAALCNRAGHYIFALWFLSFFFFFSTFLVFKNFAKVADRLKISVRGTFGKKTAKDIRTESITSCL